jgi:predicted AlkP superfamily phosphohydrolase/phosphomutase
VSKIVIDDNNNDYNTTIADIFQKLKSLFKKQNPLTQKETVDDKDIELPVYDIVHAKNHDKS